MARRRSRSPDTSALLTMAVASVLPSAGLLALPGHPVDWATLPCLGAATPLQALAMTWLHHHFKRYRRRWWYYSVLALIPSVLGGFAIPHGLNQLLDQAVPEQVKVFVAQGTTSGEASRVVESDTQRSLTVRLPPGQAQTGQTTSVSPRRGLFHWRWQAK